MIKVCHLISGDLWAGAEVMAFNLIRRLSQYKDVELHVIVLNHGKLAEELKINEIPVYINDEKKLSFYSIIKNTINTIKHIKPDIVHSHRYKENIINFLSIHGSRLKKKPKLISTQHGMPDGISARNGERGSFSLSVHGFNNYILSRHFHCTVSVSRDIQTFLIKNGNYSLINTKVIRNGIKIPSVQEKIYRDKIFKIGSAARFFRIKDFPLIVDIAKILIEKNNNIQFILAGEGPERGVVQSLVKEFDIEKYFLFPGFINETSDFFQGLDLYINTSFHEGIPMSVLEAMAHGIPVVAPAVGGFCEIIDNGMNGFLVDSRDPMDFAKLCLKVIDNIDIRKKISHEAREKIIRDFSVEKMADSYMKLYHDTIFK
jgi:glycosyltransferase involved in cell wall biosynthesis